MAKREPNALVTSVDRRQVIKLAQRIAEQMGVANRIKFRPGNIFSLNYGSDEYDLVLISNVLHQYSRETALKLFKKAHAAVRSPDGTIVVHDFVADDTRSKDTASLLMGLDMLLYTEEGNVHTYSEYKSWLEESGFTDISSPIRISGNFTSFMTARKS
jgi:2-polyprenyl-3-methyl-5-hydroxy-6-metoxy-1,4-benzoquinol methylase